MMRKILVATACSLLALCAAAQELNLTYDANGNVQTRTTPQGATTYANDALDRLVTESGPARSQTIGYDANGNRTSDGVQTYTLVVDSNILASIGGVAVTTDAAGNLTQWGLYSYTWNQAGQLSQVSYNGKPLASYYYDYLGRRSRKVTYPSAPQGAATILYVYDPQSHLLEEEQVVGSTAVPIMTYVWRDDTLVGVIARQPSRQVYTVLTDQIGSPIEMRNSAGVLVWTWYSDAFGTTLPNGSPTGGPTVTMNLRFPGQYYDAESGLHYNGHRYYAPTIGRYISSDPIGLQGGINTYAYVFSNPLGNLDADGENAVGAFVGSRIGAWLGGIGGEAIDPLGGGIPGAALGSWLGGRAGDAASDWAFPPPAAAAAAASIPGDTSVAKPAIPDRCPDDLCEQLTLAEAKAGAGKTIMTVLGDAPRLVALYGQGPWVKRQHTHICPDGRKLVVHYFSNGRGLNVELKFV